MTQTELIEEIERRRRTFCQVFVSLDELTALREMVHNCGVPPALVSYEEQRRRYQKPNGCWDSDIVGYLLNDPEKACDQARVYLSRHVVAKLIA